MEEEVTEGDHVSKGVLKSEILACPNPPSCMVQLMGVLEVS